MGGGLCAQQGREVEHRCSPTHMSAVLERSWTEKRNVAAEGVWRFLQTAMLRFEVRNLGASRTAEASPTSLIPAWPIEFICTYVGLKALSTSWVAFIHMTEKLLVCKNAAKEWVRRTIPFA